jgi:ATP-dependent DNA helicase RecG
MDVIQINHLARAGESPSLELKTSTSQLSGACETVCAFLNAKGGTVLIGIKNNGQIIGQHVTDNTRQEIAREIKKIEPPANEQINIDYVPFHDNKFVIVIAVTAGNHAPYIYDGRPYARIESSTGSMSQHHYEQLLVRRGQLNHAWDTQPAKGYSIDSLDHEDIRRTIKDGLTSIELGLKPSIMIPTIYCVA